MNLLELKISDQDNKINSKNKELRQNLSENEKLIIESNKIKDDNNK